MLQLWKQSSFRQRHLLIRVLLKYITEHQEDICRCTCVSPGPALPAPAHTLSGQGGCRVAALDSGKVMVDAAFGEVMVTCEKATWLLAEGERWLRPESRSAGRMVCADHCTAWCPA